jgi:hypothetical protein
MITRSSLAALAIVTLAAVPAAAEPMFLSKQYNRCSACHYSPSGGGLLTSYGRALSGQEISTFRRSAPAASPEGTVSGEEAFLYGALGDRLGPVALGISLRPSYLHYEFGTFSDSRRLLMNADLSGAFRNELLTIYGEVGRKPAIGTESAEPYSREHWVSIGGERGLSVRGGRFLPAYGVHFADHTILTRRDLGFDMHDQVYGVEVSHATDLSLLQVSLSPGRAESIVDDDGRRAFTAAGRFQRDLGPTLVVVGSGLFRNESDAQPRSGVVGGALGVAPLPRLTIWTEGDAHIRDGGLGTSFVFANETSWEVARGVWLKVSPQGRTGTDVVPGLFRWSAGASLFPRTHWNVGLTFYRDKVENAASAVETFLAQLHLYL